MIYYERIPYDENNNHSVCHIITDSYSREDSCSCDHFCLIYGDCCHDFVQICSEEVTRGQRLKEEYGIKRYPTSTCVPWIEETEFNRILELDPENDPEYLFKTKSRHTSIINVCFKTGKLCKSTENNLNNYQMLNYQLPVIDTKTGINYINYDCARCNTRNTTAIEPWKYSLNCSSFPGDKLLSHKLPQNIVQYGIKRYPASTCVPWIEETEFNRILELDPENDPEYLFKTKSRHTSIINVCFKTSKLCRSTENNLNNYQMLNYQLPVIDTKTGINYINYDCARCNTRNTTAIEPWKYSLNCSSFPGDKLLSHKLPQNIVQHGCKFILLSPMKTRYCITTNLQCHPNCKNKQLFDACHSPTQRIAATDKTHSYILFKNEYCAMCHFDSLQSITFKMTCDFMMLTS